MDKVEKLEKRIEELESKIEKLEGFRQLTKQQEIREDLLAMGNNLVATSREDFEEHFSKKYSKETYRKKGFPKEYNQLDINDAIEEASNQKNRDDKLLYWSKYQHEIREILGNDYYSDYWLEFIGIIKKAVEFYQNDVIRYILKQGKYIDRGGPREEKDKKEKGYRIYRELKQKRNPEFFHQNGRHKGGPKWDKIEPILRNKLDKEYGSIRSIKDYIREQEK